MEKICPYIQKPCIKDQCLAWKGGTCAIFTATSNPQTSPVRSPSPEEVRRQTNVEHLKRIKEKYPQAYASWTADADEDLTQRYRAGEKVAGLAAHFQRQPSAIRSRLRKLGLVSDYLPKTVSEFKPRSVPNVVPRTVSEHRLDNGNTTTSQGIVNELLKEFTPENLTPLLDTIKKVLFQTPLNDSKKCIENFKNVLRLILITAGFTVYDEYPIQYFTSRHSDGSVTEARGKIFLYATHSSALFRLAIEMRDGAYVKYRSFEKILQCDVDCGIILSRGSFQPEYVQNNRARFAEVVKKISQHLNASQGNFKLKSKRLWLGVQKIQYWEPLPMDYS